MMIEMTNAQPRKLFARSIAERRSAGWADAVLRRLDSRAHSGLGAFDVIGQAEVRQVLMLGRIHHLQDRPVVGLRVGLDDDARVDVIRLIGELS